MSELNHPYMLSSKDYSKASVFHPENLLREARRQKSIAECNIPEVCVLDPDGDILEYLRRTDRASLNECWAGYHTHMYEFDLQGRTVGIIGQAVGASFAVLLAEQMFVSGCKLLISITSAGRLNQQTGGEKFILIEEALRDEGTSYHYLPADHPAILAPDLLDALISLQEIPDISVGVGKSWTTDAPYRETKSAITHAESLDAVAVEMEAAALYAFAEARERSVVCFAHLTNTMAQQEKDFEKGKENGSIASLNMIYHSMAALGYD